jgi:uncharacterized protein
MTSELKMIPEPNMTSESKIIQCPACRMNVRWDNESPHRPFCSESCKNKDFVSWANEEHVFEGNSLYDGVLSEELIMPE